MKAFIKPFLLLGFFLALIVPIQDAVQFPIQGSPGNASLGSKTTDEVTIEDYPADDHGGALETFSHWFSSDDSATQSKLNSQISSRAPADTVDLNFREGKKDVKIYKYDIDNEQHTTKINHNGNILKEEEKAVEKETASKGDDLDKGDVENEGLLHDYYSYSDGEEY